MQLDEGATGAPRVFGPRTDTTKITQEEISAALDVASVELGIERPIPYEAESNLFAPVQGKLPVGDPSVADQNYFIGQGYSVGQLPKKYQNMFGDDPTVIGWKIITNPDGSQSISVARPQGDADGGFQFQTYGATFKQDAAGNIAPFSTGTLTNTLTSTLGNGTVSSAATGPTLASDVFKQTLAIFFGPTEMAKPWATELYNVVSKFYKQGATSEEAFNMAVLESEKNPALADFTKRFKGIYALQKMKQAGKAVTVPTIAEYFATESKMGDILKQSNLGDLANEDFLGDVLAKGVSATEFANRITAIFDRIDNAPKNIKDTISRYFPTVDRISLAKAIALGDKGAKELQAQVAGYEVLSAAEKQGLSAGQLVGGTTVESAYQYALGGETYDTALTKFGTVAAMLPTVNKLTQVYGEETLGQAGVESAVFGKSAKEIKRLEDLAKKEEASFSGRSGVSQISLASQRRGAGLI